MKMLSSGSKQPSSARKPVLLTVIGSLGPNDGGACAGACVGSLLFRPKPSLAVSREQDAAPGRASKSSILGPAREIRSRPNAGHLTLGAIVDAGGRLRS
jgi:hypothetical protein